MNSYIYLWYITRYLAWFVSQVRIENKNGNFDISKHAESFLIPILNELFSKEFERLEYQEINYPAIDIGSKDKEISIQITSEKGFDKIENTIGKFIAKGEYKKYKKLYHVVIHEEYTTQKTNDDINTIITDKFKEIDEDVYDLKITKEENILNISDLRRKIEETCDIEGLKKIQEYLEKQYGKVTSLPTFDDILIPYEVAFIEQLNLENENLPYQFHTPFFGRERHIGELQDFISDDKKNVMAISADGGYGKTRLVIEVFKELCKKSNYETFVLNEAGFHCIDFAEQVKTDKKVIVLFDDAHLRPEILNDIIGVAERLANVKVILTIRKAVYNETLKRVSTHRSSFEQITLERLSYQETQDLFKSQLPGLKDVELKKVSQESKGIPIVVLTLCQAYIEGKYKEGITEEDNFRRFVNSLKLQLIKDLHEQSFIEKDKINKVICLLSFISPLKRNEKEIVAFSNILGLTSDDVNIILEYLAQYDFVSDFNEYKIKPDLYSDIILIESALHLKYFLNKDVNIFVDRIIRNLVQVENVQNIGLNIDSLLADFINSFKSKNIENKDDVRRLESDLESLRSFAYKKPKLCFIAIRNLLESKESEDRFWNNYNENDLFSISYKSIHDIIATVLSIIAINIHTKKEHDDLYLLVKHYAEKIPELKIFQKIYKFREFDFYEYGYRPFKVCERQFFLIDKLKEIKERANKSEDFDFIYDCCSFLLALEFESETYYDKYEHTISYGRHFVIYNDKTKELRICVLKLLVDIYMICRYEKHSEKYLDQILRVLFFMSNQKRTDYQFNQEEELLFVIDFIKMIIGDKPTVYERSQIIRQLRIFERKEIKEKYADNNTELIRLTEEVKNNKEKLQLLFLDQYLSVRVSINDRMVEIIQQYPDWGKLISDIISVKKELKEIDATNFGQILDYIIKEHPEEARRMLLIVLKENIEVISDYALLIKSCYEDRDLFYQIINEIWESETEKKISTILWMLTHGRKEDLNLYELIDLDYFKKAIELDIEGSLWSLSFTLPKYLIVSPEKTVELMSILLEKGVYDRNLDHLMYSLFKEKELITKNALLIKDMLLKHTMKIPLDSYYMDSIIKFLDDNFGFKIVFDHLKEKISVIKESNDYVSLSFSNHYYNHDKDKTKAEIEFIDVIEWYGGLNDKNEFLEKRIVEYLRPVQIESEEFFDELKDRILKAGKDIEYILGLFEGLDVYENKSEKFVQNQIEIANDLCNRFDVSEEMLVKIFGYSYIYNSGMKSGPAGMPFQQDIEKRKEFERILKEYELHDNVRNLFEKALSNVQKDIDRDRASIYDEKW